MAGQAEPGRLIGGRYRLLARLGSGGMGRVWRAADEALRIEVAVKEVWLPASPGPDADERLRRAEREARNAARLRDHPNVVAVHDVVVEDGVPWTVMQLVAGHTLEEQVARSGPLSVAHAAVVAGGLLDALEAAHAAGIVHRDVKPANVMLADDGTVLLTDFGIALGTTDTALTQAGTFLGSVEFIAPERARGTEGLAASDLFSLGVTLFQAVEGFSPFHRETATGTLTAVILDEAPAPVRAGRLTPLITGLLAKDPAARLGIGAARRLLAAPETAATAAAPAVSVPEARVAPTAAAGAAAPRTGQATARGTGAAPTRRPSEANRPPSQSTGIGTGTGTAQRRRPPAPQPTRRRPEVPRAGIPRGSTGSGPRSSQSPKTTSAPRRRRGLILVLLIAATIGGVLFATMRHPPASYDVTGVRVGEFVKVDDNGHITGKLTERKAATTASGRRVTAREDQADPDVCRKFHAAGRPDVETDASVSFCLVHPGAAPAEPAQ